MDPRLPSLVTLNGRITPSLNSFILSSRLREVMLATHGPSAASRLGVWARMSSALHAARRSLRPTLAVWPLLPKAQLLFSGQPADADERELVGEFCPASK